ncbi:hypothetical protein LTR74_000294 [Friedmanniomyces endolithicus]|nr:hypothetical protein LTR74_000294 [Friedmanniomyces endolithicus]
MADSAKVNDMTFMFLVLHAPKQGVPKFKFLADSLGLPNAKAAENKYYKLKKAHWDTVGGAELVLKGMGSADTPTKTNKKTDTPKSMKHQRVTDEDDQESPAAKKGKGSAKKMKAANGHDEAPTKVEPKAEDDFT